MNVWTLILGKRGVEHDKEALETLLQFRKSQGIEITTDAAFSVNVCERVSQLIFDSASRGDKIAINVLTTWRTLMDTLKLIIAKRNAEAAAKMPVPVVHDGREHISQASKSPQNGRRHVAQEPPAQEGAARAPN